MQYDEHLRKQLRGTAPPGSQKFILIGDCEGPSCRRWPTDGFFPLWDDNPVDVPDGLYLISFTNAGDLSIDVSQSSPFTRMDMAVCLNPLLSMTGSMMPTLPETDA